MSCEQSTRTAAVYAKNTTANITPMTVANAEAGPAPAPTREPAAPVWVVVELPVALALAPELVRDAEAPDAPLEPDEPVAAAAPLEPEPVTDAADETTFVGVGSEVKRSVDWNGVQFEEAGTRGWYGMVEMGPSDSAGWV